MSYPPYSWPSSYPAPVYGQSTHYSTFNETTVPRQYQYTIADIGKEKVSLPTKVRSIMRKKSGAGADLLDAQQKSDAPPAPVALAPMTSTFPTWSYPTTYAWPSMPTTLLATTQASTTTVTAASTLESTSTGTTSTTTTTTTSTSVSVSPFTLANPSLLPYSSSAQFFPGSATTLSYPGQYFPSGSYTWPSMPSYSYAPISSFAPISGAALPPPPPPPSSLSYTYPGQWASPYVPSGLSTTTWGSPFPMVSSLPVSAIASSTASASAETPKAENAEKPQEPLKPT